MAGGVLGYLANRYGEKLPVTSIIEADESACVLASAKAGERVAIGGNPQTVMAGLNCGEVEHLHLAHPAGFCQLLYFLP